MEVNIIKAIIIEFKKDNSSVRKIDLNQRINLSEKSIAYVTSDDDVQLHQSRGKLTFEPKTKQNVERPIGYIWLAEDGVEKDLREISTEHLYISAIYFTQVARSYGLDAPLTKAFDVVLTVGDWLTIFDCELYYRKYNNVR